MRIYPQASEQLIEFDKVKVLLGVYCRTEYAKNMAASLRIHTCKEYIVRALTQTLEYKLILEQGLIFPNNIVLNINKDIHLLGIAGSTLLGDQWLGIKKLCQFVENLFRWFTTERRKTYTGLASIIENSYYEKSIVELIDGILDETGNVLDHASADLQQIRLRLYKKRIEIRRVFDKVVARLNKAGYSADIEEGFSNGRRVVAVFSEHKRHIKGILHGESDSRKTSYIEPEETLELNNEIYGLENDERKEVQRILRDLTSKLRIYAPLLSEHHTILGVFDFIYAKAMLARDMNANCPQVADKAFFEVRDAFHPLLLLYNKKTRKQTIPLNISFSEANRILVISGPNAGGKTVAMKTIALQQLMMQSGLLIPVHPDSRMGIFKQMLIHIGDTQSIEFELSTYSAQLSAMKYFLENANGKTLFFIDELGGGSDPDLGGAFAEVILEELSKKHAVGIVTTHYLNLKVMANHTTGLFNGAMAFDEERLEPIYKLVIGKPGSSYTFSIAERIGLPKHLITRARMLVDDNHFKLDKLLNNTEQDLQKIEEEKKELQNLVHENEKLKKELKTTLHKEKHSQHLAILKQQNKISEDRIKYLKDTERKLRQMVLAWRKAEEKEDVIKEINQLLFPKNEKLVVGKKIKKLEAIYKETDLPITVGTRVKIKKNHHIGEVKEIRGKRAIVQINNLPLNVDIAGLTAVIEKEKDNK